MRRVATFLLLSLGLSAAAANAQPALETDDRQRFPPGIYTLF